MSSIQSKTILFVTGCFVSHHCWNDWAAYFESQGYKTVTPHWPGKAGEPAALRNSQPNKAIASLRLTQVLEHYISVIKQLPELPVIIGHSFGGLLTQLLINRGYGVAGVAIHSVPPQGVLPIEFSFLRSTFAALGLFTPLDEAYLMSFKTWQYAFTNGFPLELQHATYNALTIPESKRLCRDGLTSAAHVDFKKPHAPLLLQAGAEDHIIPASLNRRNFRAYKTPGSVTDFVVKEGRNHFVLGLPTWKEDARDILDWIRKQ
ncbi:alpha/beta hydrolase [Chitinophaga sedimenti]|uniref:alpha/beta hydrolase n=1 Tax=Chitinophaga sedimenti TaxID=2033606 RepID=UPI0020058EA4|nr:alpha/beta hydrolase [Chitinophaga sedimenti]MCK7554989.1 alpha/beta hydrolase [Chitinophaga sedimenti]